MKQDRTVLIVDDSDVDRAILKAILDDEFMVIEKTGGFSAINYLKKGKDEVDAMLLDVSMPAVDGFGVLEFMKDTGIQNIPVFLITAEATRSNVEKAARYSVVEFIRKPFDKDYIIKRIRLQLGILSEYTLTDEDYRETYKYIAELEMVYKRYLLNFGGDIRRYSRITGLMKILLTRYAVSPKEQRLDKDRIDIISKAGYFFDIGNMVVPPRTVKVQEAGQIRDSYQHHTTWGAELISLNHSEHCRYFIDVCADICMHHHERYDGKGFPHRIVGDHNLLGAQMCSLAERFDRLFMQIGEHGEEQFAYVLGEIEKDEGYVSKEVLSALADCGQEIVAYYAAMEEN